MLANNKKEVQKMPLVIKDSDLNRFWSRVGNIDNKEDCWEWQGRIKGGYGQFKFGNVVYVAHRVSYFLHFKVDPLQNLCCHTCDNRKCINPNHIFLGTQLENYEDAVNKKRATVIKGETHMNAKLNEEKVKAMIEEYAKGGVTQSQLGEKYGIDGKYVDVVLKGRVWKHVECERIKTINPRISKMTENKVKALLKDHFIKKIKYPQLAKIYGISVAVVCGIVKGKLWKNVSRVINGIICKHSSNLSSSKLEASQVSEIKKRYTQGGITFSTLAKTYNVKDEAIRRIIQGITWKNVA